jgi:hypothetical protein
MSQTYEKVRDYNGWVFKMPDEIAKNEGYDEGSKIVLTFENGKVDARVLPPNSEKLNTEIDRLVSKYGEAFEEQKSICD